MFVPLGVRNNVMLHVSMYLMQNLNFQLHLVVLKHTSRQNIMIEPTLLGVKYVYYTSHKGQYIDNIS